jgi:hypothetical protein
VSFFEVIAHIVANPWKFASFAEAAEDLRNARQGG